MGTVYKARQPKLNRFVALKVMSPELAQDPDFVARFKREAAAAASFSHPNAVQVFAAGEYERTPYIAMEFVDGVTLKEHIEQHGRLDARESIAVAVYVAQALQYGWNKARIIHRDIKPDNVFLSKTGEVKVGDLGLAKTVGGVTTSLTQTGMMMGSPHYISPEQARGESDIDFRADIYSLGCTLFHMLTGRPPYTGTDPLSVISKHVNEPPPAIFKVWPTCPIPLALVVGKMLAKHRHERPKSYEELLDQLQDVHDKLKSGGVATAPAAEPARVVSSPTPKPPTPKPVVVKVATSKPAETVTAWRSGGGWKWVVGGLAGVAVLAVAAGAVWWFASQPAESRVSKSNDVADRRKVDTAKAITLFDGRDTSAWQHRDGRPCQWAVTDGALVVGDTDLDTREKFQDFELHAEFAVPDDSKQGNSGIYLQGRYELQILESFEKPANDTCCGAIFRMRAPNENVSKRPDEWQSFDITFHAARFDAVGGKISNARVTILHNGRTIHNDAMIPRSTGKGDPESAAPGPVRLQAFGSAVRFRNIRITPLEAAGAEAGVGQTAAQVVNLLHVTDPVKDRVRVEKGAIHSNANAWERRGSFLAYISDGGSGKLAPPVAIHAAHYAIEVEFERLSGEGRFHVDLPLDGNRIIPMNLDNTHLKMVNCRGGEPWPVNRGSRARVVVRLDRSPGDEQDTITVRLDGEREMVWRGNAATVSQDGEPHPDFPGQPVTSIYIHKDSYEVRYWQLRIFEGEATVLRNPASTGGAGWMGDGAFGFAIAGRPLRKAGTL